MIIDVTSLINENNNISMTNIFLLILSVLPVIFLLWYFERQDKGEKEPLKLKRKVFIWGILATIFAGFIEVLIDPLWFEITSSTIFYAFLTSFFTAAIIEEGLKLWVVKSNIDREKDFNEVMDGISYMIIASLGFAMLENIFYVLSGGLIVAIIRAILSVPAHAMFSGIMGYYVGKARFEPLSFKRRKLIFKGFGIAVLYHGLFNFFLLSETVLIFFVIPLMITMGLHLKQKIQHARYEDKIEKIKPKKLTYKMVVKVFIASIFIIVGTGSFIGSILLSNDPSSGYGSQQIIQSGIFALVMYVFTYFLLRKKSD